MSLISSLSEAIDDRLNPIVVKELRQAVQSKFVTVMILLLLLAQVTIIGVWLLSKEDIAAQSSGGREMFLVLMGTLVIVSSLLVPLYTGIRFAYERSDTNMDLLYGTTISPWAIVRGKFICAAALAAIIYGACMPFIVLTYLLRGIDVPTILLVVGEGYIALLAVSALTILLASPRIGIGWRIGLGLVAAAAVISNISGVISSAVGMSFFGMGMAMGTWGFWSMVLTTLAVFAVAALLCLQGAVAVISPPLSNRTRPLRITATAVIVLCGGLAFAWTNGLKEPDMMLAWLIPAVALLCVAMLVGVSERDHLSVRVARSVPRSRLWRPLAFVFCCGWAGGVLWTLLAGAVCLGAVYAIDWFRGSFAAWWGGSTTWAGPTSPLLEGASVMLVIGLYVYAYSMTALLLTRTILKRRVATNQTWLVAIIVASIFNAVPLAVGFVVAGNNWSELYNQGTILLGGPASMAYETLRSSALIVSAAWSVLATLLSVPLFIRQFAQFHPPIEAAVEPARVQVDATNVS